MKTFARLVARASTNAVGGPESGTQYDLRAACAVCGTGARQVGPLVLRRFRLPKAALFSTLDDEILVTGALADALRSGGFGSCLGEVQEAKSKVRLPVSQLIPQAELPRFSARTTGVVRERPCRSCDRDGYFGVPNQPVGLHYEQLDARLLELDLLATYERFGNSRLREPFRESVFAAPLYVVSNRLGDVLSRERAAGVELQPVVIEL